VGVSWLRVETQLAVGLPVVGGDLDGVHGECSSVGLGSSVERLRD
jgi:hypothetical protein